MRLAYVSTDPGIPVFGMKGGSIHIQEVIRAFIARGAEVTVISPRLDEEAPYDLACVRQIPLPSLPKQNAETRAKALLQLNANVIAALEGLAPLDMIYERHALFAHGAMELALETDVPGVLEVNAPLMIEQEQHRELSLSEHATLSTRRAMSAASQITAVSHQVQTYCVEHGALRSCVQVLPNGVNPKRFPKRRPPDGPFTIGFLGTLKPWHDVRTVIEALALLKRQVASARFLIVGDGPERARLEEQAAKLDLRESVTFVGLVSPDRVPDELAQMHVAVAPYSPEGSFYFSPLKIYEYMATGLPVVASKVGHLQEVIRDGRTGLLCEPGNPATLASALFRLANSKVMQMRLGSAARIHVLENCTWDHVVGRVLERAGLADRRLSAIAS